MRFKTAAIIMSFALILAAAATAALAGGHGGAHWGYEAEAGPVHWGDMSEEYALCKEGSKQSPIDISEAEEASLPEIEFDYKDVPLGIINNGHAIQVNYAPGSSIALNGERYALLQFHFHTPSENTLRGKAYDMEAHLVHKNDAGKLAVIGVFMEAGAENPFITALWEHLPSEEGHENKVESVKVNAMSMLPQGKAYYNFSGSLTTPPCSEDVNWMVMKDAVKVSEDQVRTFAGIFKMNARPVQPLNGRSIRASH